MNKIFAAKLEEIAKVCGKKFIIGVSGGGDSLALAKLCADFAKTHTEYQFLAIIIDHGIAQNSDEVANIAKERVEQIGLQAKILRIQSKITNSIQENARNLRYDLLCQSAKEFGANSILLAHNHDDQIETILFRMARGTGILGLATMAEIAISPFWLKHDGILLARPLLWQSRQDLRDYLKAQNIDYFDDPANENTLFSRVKIRKRIKEIQSHGFDFAKLDKIISTAQVFRQTLSRQCADYILANCNFENDKVLMPSIEKWPTHLSALAFEVLIKTLAQDTRNIKEQKIQNLLAGLKNANFRGATLANIMIKNKKNHIVFSIAPKRQNFAQNPALPLDFEKAIFANLGLINEYIGGKIK